MKFLNVFFSETARAIFTIYHMGPSGERVLMICSNGSEPLNKMAAMLIYVYGKNILIFSSPASKKL